MPKSSNSFKYFYYWVINLSYIDKQLIYALSSLSFLFVYMEKIIIPFDQMQRKPSYQNKCKHWLLYRMVTHLNAIC